MKNKVDVSIASDYAILSTPNYSFYYGYEYDIKEDEDGDTTEIWGFEVTNNNKKVFRISVDEMEKYKRCPNKWECNEMLLFGIGLYIASKE